jgi:hypothetical protein
MEEMVQLAEYWSEVAGRREEQLRANRDAARRRAESDRQIERIRRYAHNYGSGREAISRYLREDTEETARAIRDAWANSATYREQGARVRRDAEAFMREFRRMYGEENTRRDRDDY